MQQADELSGRRREGSQQLSRTSSVPLDRSVHHDIHDETIPSSRSQSSRSQSSAVPRTRERSSSSSREEIAPNLQLPTKIFENACPRPIDRKSKPNYPDNYEPEGRDEVDRCFRGDTLEHERVAHGRDRRIPAASEIAAEDCRVLGCCGEQRSDMETDHRAAHCSEPRDGIPNGRTTTTDDESRYNNDDHEDSYLALLQHEEEQQRAIQSEWEEHERLNEDLRVRIVLDDLLQIYEDEYPSQPDGTGGAGGNRGAVDDPHDDDDDDDDTDYGDVFEEDEDDDLDRLLLEIVGGASSESAPGDNTEIEELVNACDRRDRDLGPPALPQHHQAVGAGASENGHRPPTAACVVCLEAPRTHAYVPCGHLCVCLGCVRQQAKHRRSSVASCPVCKQPATGVMRIFIP